MTDTARDPAAVGSGRYAAIAILLHWLIAAAILMQIVLAWRMDGPLSPQTFAVTQLHKSVGISILLLSLARLAWRLANSPPPLPATMSRLERGLAAVTHVGFYVIMIGMPLTGWIMVSASKFNIPTLLYGVVPWPHLPLVHLAPAAKDAWHEVGEAGHLTLAWGLVILFALHVAGALKHQLFSRDEPVLARMAPGAVAGRWLEPRLLAIVGGAAAALAFGFLVMPPHPGLAAPRAAVTSPEPAEAQAPAEPVAAASPAAGNAAAPAATAEPAPTPTPAPAAPAEPSRWAIEPGSTVSFATTWGGQAIQGRFDRWTADILFGPEALAKSKVTVEIELASVNSGDAQRDASLPSDDWFAAAAHPKATFTATRFEKTGPDRYLARGVLSLRGVEKPLALPFTLKIDGDRARARGVTSLDRTAFGVGQGEWAKTDQIPAKVSVSIDLKARRR